MKIELTVSMAGANVSYKVGDVLDTTDSEAIRLIEAGFAKPVRSKEPEHTAKRKPTVKGRAK